MTKKILKLAIPSIIENTLHTSVGFIDTLLITGIGIFAVTAIGSANSVINIYLAVFVAISIAVSSLVSRYIGSKDTQSATLEATKGFVLVTLCSLLFFLITLIFSNEILTLIGLEEVYIKSAKIYLMVVGSSSLFIGLTTYLSALLRAQEDTKSPLLVGFLMNIMNIVLDLVLIYGFLFIPQLGVLGTALGTVISRIIGTLILLYIVQKKDIKINFKSMFKIDKYRPLIKLTVPAALERLVMRFGQFLYFGMIIFIGSKTFAAHMIAAQIEGFTYMPALGLATAASTLIGIAVGKKNYEEAKKIGYCAVMLGVISMSILGVIEFIYAPNFASIFTNDVEVITDIVNALRTDAFIQGFVATSLILTGALQGMGDTKTPLLATLSGMWLIRVLGVYMLGINLNLGIIGVWMAIGIDLFIRSIVLIIKYEINFKKLVGVGLINE